MATKWTPELNALVKQRGGLEKGSNEYNAVQNQINKSMGDKTRHDVAEIAPAETQMGSHGADMDAQGSSGTTYTGVNPIHGSTDNRHTRANQQMVDNATAPGGGQIKNSGSGNTFAAALTPDGSGYTPLDSFYASAKNREGMGPQFSPGGEGERYTQDDIHFDSTTDEGIEDRFSYQMNSNKDKRKSAREANKLGRQNKRAMKKDNTVRSNVEKFMPDGSTNKQIRQKTRETKRSIRNQGGNPRDYYA